MKLFRALDAFYIQSENQWYRSKNIALDDLFSSSNPSDWLRNELSNIDSLQLSAAVEDEPLLPPLQNQEVWAAGVTYYRSREARMQESEKAGGDAFYDRVYDADRPELFFKASPARAVGHRQKVAIRSDSKWNVPEPELTLAINANAKIFGFTIGNDMSSRDIEGENPLYLPQVKVYQKSCALGPALVLSDNLSPETVISLEIERSGKTCFQGNTRLSQIKRPFDNLVEYLYRDNAFPCGCYLMTGTGIVPTADLSLQSGDCIKISIDSLGSLENEVE